MQTILLVERLAKKDVQVYFHVILRSNFQSSRTLVKLGNHTRQTTVTSSVILSHHVQLSIIAMLGKRLTIAVPCWVGIM